MGTKPEIYAMGFRNPFRFAVDRATGWVYLGEYGPDAGAANPNRGPGGQVEFNLIKQPGNYGWPYCTGKNDAYNQWDFATNTGGAKFDCNAPKNTSPNNTGLIDLPPAVPAWIAYDGGSIPAFGSGSESPMGGPTYHYDASNPSTTKFPAYFDGKNFAYEFGRAWIKTFTGGADGSLPADRDVLRQLRLQAADRPGVRPRRRAVRPRLRLRRLLPGRRELGRLPDRLRLGAAQPGGGRQGRQDVRPRPAGRAVLLRRARSTPTAATSPTRGTSTTTARSTRPSPTRRTPSPPAGYTAALTVKDPSGKEAHSSVNIVSGNTMPTVKINLPANGAIYDYGDTIKYTITVTDPEDGTIDCSKVRSNTALGHNDHSHGDQSMTGCSGQFTIPQAWEDKTQHTWYILGASYTDKTTGLELTGTNQVILEWRTQQAEMFDENSGMQETRAAAAAGGGRMGYTDPGDYLKFSNINLTGITSVTARTTGVANSRFELRVDSPTGPLVASIPVVSSGDWEIYKTQEPARGHRPGRDARPLRRVPAVQHGPRRVHVQRSRRQRQRDAGDLAPRAPRRSPAPRR